MKTFHTKMVDLVEKKNSHKSVSTQKTYWKKNIYAKMIHTRTPFFQKKKKSTLDADHKHNAQFHICGCRPEKNTIHQIR